MKKTFWMAVFLTVFTLFVLPLVGYWRDWNFLMGVGLGIFGGSVTLLWWVLWDDERFDREYEEMTGIKEDA